MSHTSKHGFEIASLMPFAFASRSAAAKFLNSSESTTIHAELSFSISPVLTAYLSDSSSRDSCLATFKGSPSICLYRTLPRTSISLIKWLKYSVSVTIPLDTIKWRFRLALVCFLRPRASPLLSALAIYVSAFLHQLGHKLMETRIWQGYVDSV